MWSDASLFKAIETKIRAQAVCAPHLQGARDLCRTGEHHRTHVEGAQRPAAELGDEVRCDAWIDGKAIADHHGPVDDDGLTNEDVVLPYRQDHRSHSRCDEVPPAHKNPEPRLPAQLFDKRGSNCRTPIANVASARAGRSPRSRLRRLASGVSTISDRRSSKTRSSATRGKRGNFAYKRTLPARSTNRWRQARWTGIAWKETGSKSKAR